MAYLYHLSALMIGDMIRIKKTFFAILLTAQCLQTYAQFDELNKYNVVWTSQSKNSAESMPCGGGDIGLNVWVENGDLLIYVSKSGTFDENNSFLKLGRLRVQLSPNVLAGNNFVQQLFLKDGYIEIKDANGGISAQIKVWVDVYRPVVHVDISTSKAIMAKAAFESWRYQNRQMLGRENNQSSYKFAAPKNTLTFADSVGFVGASVLFYHQNRDSTVFDAEVKQQGMEAVKGQMYNPLKKLTFGGLLQGDGMIPAGTSAGTYQHTTYKGWQLQSAKASAKQTLSLYLYTEQTADLNTWKNGLQAVVKNAELAKQTAFVQAKAWWQQYWQRSFIAIGASHTDSVSFQLGRNYQLFRYMLGCNAYGKWPTKFNGGLFTFDPILTDTLYHFTPDFRNWGGGLMTAQNQRLVYFGMLKSGDWDMMRPQFDFYLRSLKNAELRSQVYWGHAGACFTEQVENFGLPNYAEYGTKRPPGFDKGMEYNAWLEYEWDTVFQFCLMMLDAEQYASADIHEYLPFIESCLTFYNEHYQYLAKQRGAKAFDASGHLVLYPGSAAETYKMAYNSASTIAALQTILGRLLALPPQYLSSDERKQWQTMLSRIPPLPYREFKGKQTLAPARLWERLNNVETPQLYPVYPWHIYGVGKPDLQIAINTFKTDTDALKFRSAVGWKQDNIFAADLGLTDEAQRLNTSKLKDSGRRFPAFWGPGFDWTPDHNWGGSGMIGLQEMLLQTNGQQLLLFPAWPKTWDVHFKLHAPQQTTIEGVLKNGHLESLKVTPQSREKDVVNMLR